jgi:DNA-binding CsgD family transcriptional regulator
MMYLNRNYPALDRLIGDVSDGQGGSLVVRGAAGVGKTTLLAQAVDRVPANRIIRLDGSKAESDLAFGAIHRLFGQLDQDLAQLPVPQANALQALLGLVPGPPDQFLVGLAIRSLLARSANERPLICVVDDAQWLDPPSARTLAFVGRRLHGLPVGLVFALREWRDEISGLPEVELGGLSPEEARRMIEWMVPGPLDVEVRARIAAELEGAPVGIGESLKRVRPLAMAGGFYQPGFVPLSPAVEESLRARLEALPKDTCRLLLIAGAEPLGRPYLLKRAAELLSIPPGAAGPAESEGVIRMGAVVRFRHPAMRSVVYRAASPAERRLVHEALAEATDRDVDPDRYAWHLAYATAAPDEGVATKLEQAASLAQVKGGLAAGAALLNRAAALTPDPVLRSKRILAAGEAKMAAGALDEALELLAGAESEMLETQSRARLARLLAQVDAPQLGRSDASSMLLRLAKRLVPIDARMARDTCIQALTAAIHAGHLLRDDNIADVAQETRAMFGSAQPVGAIDVLVDGWATLYTDGYTAAVLSFQQALHGFEREKSTRGILLGAGVAVALWDDATACALANRQREHALSTGAMNALKHSLISLATLAVYAGKFADAVELIEQAALIESPPTLGRRDYAPMMLAAYRGREAEATEVIAEMVGDANIRREGRAVAVAEEMTAVLHNGLGNYRVALAAAQGASERGQLGASDRALAELVEAAVRCDERGVAEDALARLCQRTTVCGTDWALGIEARSRALLSQGREADELYRTAIERLGRCSIATALARAHLLYGEWLRGVGRRKDARQQLHIALEMFSDMGAEAFAARAEGELTATGEKLYRRGAESEAELTPQEAEICELAREGHSNPEIAAKLYLSPRTVEYHLGKVFRKLGVSSRNELRRVGNSQGKALLRV